MEASTVGMSQSTGALETTQRALAQQRAESSQKPPLGPPPMSTVTGDKPLATSGTLGTRINTSA